MAEAEGRGRGDRLVAPQEQNPPGAPRVEAVEEPGRRGLHMEEPAAPSTGHGRHGLRVAGRRGESSVVPRRAPAESRVAALGALQGQLLESLLAGTARQER